MKDVIAIVRGPSPMYTYLTSYGVAIRDAASISHRLVATFERSRESIEDEGVNSWIQWMKRDTFVFGTCSGKCFLCEFSNDTITLKKVLTFEVTITGTFACHSLMGICTSDSQILFLNDQGDVHVSSKFDLQTPGFRNPRFYPPHTLVTIADNKPFLIAIPKAPKKKPSKKHDLTTSSFSVDNAVLTAFNATTGVMAVAVANGSVILTGGPCCEKLTLIPPQTDVSMLDNVVFMQWVVNDQFLCIVQKSGHVFVYDTNTAHGTGTAIASLTRAEHMVFHDDSRSLIYTSQGTINRIEFASILQSCAFTCTGVYDYERCKFVFQIGCHQDLFPLVNVVKLNESFYVQSRCCVARIENGERTASITGDIKNIIEFREYLLVSVFESSAYKMKVCNSSLEVLSAIPISHSIHSVTKNDKFVVVSCDSRYSILTFHKSCPTGVHILTVIPDNLYVEMVTKTPRAQIKNALYFRDNGVIINTWDRKAVEHQFQKFHENDVSYIFCVDEPNMLILQKSSGFKIISDGLSYTFDHSVCLFANEYATFSLSSEIPFGEIQFERKLIAPYLIMAHSPEEWPELIPFYDQFDVKTILTHCVDLASYREDPYKLTSIMEYLCTHYKPEIVASIFESALLKFEQHQRNIFFRCMFDWGYFFDPLRDQLKKYVLMYVTPRNFEQLIVSVSDHPYLARKANITAFIRDAVKLHRYIRAFLLASQTGTDFVAVARDLHPFNSTNLEEIIGLLREDSGRWHTGDDHFSFRMMGTVFEKANLLLVALAVFLVLEETPKVSAILLNNPSLEAAASAYTHMRGRIVSPWNCPAGDSLQYRLVELTNLPPEKHTPMVIDQLAGFRIEYTHFFGRQGLIQFFDPVEARSFVSQNTNRLTIAGYRVGVRLSPLGQLIIPPKEEPSYTQLSRVICIQVIKLRVCLGIQDIYDECSQFGIVEKIICFEKLGLFALVQMKTVEQACLVRVNLTNAARHLPAFQFRVQFSRNSDIVIKFNNGKSFDFTGPDAATEFAQQREQTVWQPFFMVEKNPQIPQAFDFWRPVHFDPDFSRVLSVSGYDESRITCDILRNLFSQYGPVVRVRFAFKSKRVAHVHFANCIYARLAHVYLQGCSLFDRRLSIDFLLQADVRPAVDGGEGPYRDYDGEQDDFEIGDYGRLYFQSQCLTLRNGSLQDFPVPDDVRVEEDRLVFENEEAATEFLVMKNWTRVNGTPVLFGFANPKSGV